MSTDSAGPSNGAPDVIDLTSDDTYNTAQFSYSRRLPPLSFTARRHRHRIREQTDQDHRRYPSVDVGIVDLDATAEQSSAPQMAGNQDQQQNRNPGIRHEDSDDSDVVFVGQREVNTPSVRTGLRSEGARPVNEPRDPPRTQTGIGGLGELIREGTRGFFRHTIPYGVFTDLSSFQPPRSLGPPRGMTGRDVFFRALDVARRGGQDRVNQAEWQEDQLRGVHRGGTSSAGPQTFPAQLNFEIQGFELNQDFDDDVTFQGAATRNRANSPPYKAPSAPPEGFTRKLEEELIVVCPNCNEELGRREYDDLKKQVWVVKACGHVRLDVPEPHLSLLTMLAGVLWRMCQKSFHHEDEDRGVFDQQNTHIQEMCSGSM